MAFELVIKNANVATASDRFCCDIGVSAGKVVAMASSLPAGEKTIDAKGLLTLPGGIDSHVHLEQPGPPHIVMADGFESGTLAAAFGGNTTVMPFCLQRKGHTLRQALSDYHGAAEGNCHVDVSFHLIVSDPTSAVLGQELPALVEAGYTSLKVFMTYDDLVLTDRQMMEVMAAAKETGALVMIHAEGYDTIRFLVDRLERAEKTRPFYHGPSRPVAVEREATHRAISLAEITEVPIMIVHVSNREAMEEIARAQDRGLKIFGETCPQYLVLTEADMDREQMEGAKYVCSPPPRTSEHQQACWEGLTRGVFQVFSSDHCPYRFAEDGKLNSRGKESFRWIPNGIPGIETRLPILFSEGVKKGRIDVNRFVALTSTNHAKTYGLYPRKGTIAIGSDADIVLWDPEIRKTIRQSDLHHNCDYTPYEGLQVTGWPVTTIVRGKVIIEDGVLVDAGKNGQYLERDRSALLSSADLMR
ncbi:dihydropyrimidinase [Ensifer aridi]|uniref:dihydropyrimidinase n=1 Tax=Ensifer aridi TaxID=1708715 RepID=UPI00047AD6F6|nr:dihydropyrimidinase [Ensifer aridi]